MARSWGFHGRHLFTSFKTEPSAPRWLSRGWKDELDRGAYPEHPVCAALEWALWDTWAGGQGAPQRPEIQGGKYSYTLQRTGSPGGRVTPSSCVVEAKAVLALGQRTHKPPLPKSMAGRLSRDCGCQDRGPRSQQTQVHVLKDMVKQKQLQVLLRPSWTCPIADNSSPP